MNKNVKIILVILLILVIGIGIWWYFNSKTEQEVVDYRPQEEISDEQLRQTIVSLYFTNKDTMELIPEGRLLDVKLLLDEPYTTLMQLLIDGPKNEKLERTIPAGTKINKIELKKDVLFIDLSKEFIENHQGGEENESRTIYSIVNTMTGLTEVNGIKILIDGEENKEFKDKKINFKEIFVRIDDKK